MENSQNVIIKVRKVSAKYSAKRVIIRFLIVFCCCSFCGLINLIFPDFISGVIFGAIFGLGLELLIYFVFSPVVYLSIGAKKEVIMYSSKKEEILSFYPDEIVNIIFVESLGRRILSIETGSEHNKFYVISPQEEGKKFVVSSR